MSSSRKIVFVSDRIMALDWIASHRLNLPVRKDLKSSHESGFVTDLGSCQDVRISVSISIRNDPKSFLVNPSSRLPGADCPLDRIW